MNFHKIMKISPARRAAFEILHRIETEKAFSSILLPKFEKELGPNDSALCHEITLGVLRKKLYLDHVIFTFTKKKIAKFDVEVVTALRIGLYQLFYLDKIPDYSAINESVNLVKVFKKRSASGLVNAILRRASRGKVEVKADDPVTHVSIETSHPRWLLEHWIEQFGEKEAQEIAEANNEIPETYFRLTRKFFKSSEKLRNETLSQLSHAKSSVISDGAATLYQVRRSDENLRELAESGFIYFQDAASQLVGNLVNLAKNESFLDLCASPGSKFTQILAVFGGQGELAVAGDFYSHRIQSLIRNIELQGIDNAQIVRYDAMDSLPFAEDTFDAILIDAPCTGTGTIRHNPEIRYFLEPVDFAELSRKQLSILENASKVIKDGGRIIYSTCSLERAENEDVINAFLSNNEGYSKVLPVFDDRFITSEGFVRTFPQRESMDGFFAAVLMREA